MKFKNHIYFYPEKPILVHRDQDLVHEMSDDSDYIAEPKYNGVRCVLTVIDGEVSFWTRHGHEIKTISKQDERYIELVDEIKCRVPDKGHFQFDSEFRHKKVTGLQYKIVVWDCFIWNDEFLNKLIYKERREYVRKCFGTSQALSDKVIEFSELQRRTKMIESFESDFRKVFDEYVSGKRKLGDIDEFEGLVMKNLNGKLNLGRGSCPDSRWMFKIRIETGRHKF
jgi:ATP-dependent DNA ligase